MASSRRTPHLVCYDIREPRRLKRIHRHMKRWGLPLQYSVFYCWLTPPEHCRLARELNGLIDKYEDDVRIYAVQECVKLHWLGLRPLPDGVQLLGLSSPWEDSHEVVQAERKSPRELPVNS